MTRQHRNRSTAWQSLAALALAASALLTAPAALAVGIPFSTANTIDSSFDGASSVAATDIDSDGDMDIVSSAINAGGISWWENSNGCGTTWTEHVISDDLDEANMVGVADIDGDGWADVVGVSRANTSYLYWWRNPGGSGSWTRMDVTSDITTDGRSVHTADLDGDGDLDILSTMSYYAGEGYVTWCENLNGDGSAWQRRFLANFSGAHHAVAADLDADGDLDVLGAAYGDDSIAWFENDGSIHDDDAWTRHDIDTYFGDAICVIAADMDSDGDPDVLGAAYGDDDVIWWENDPGVAGWPAHHVDLSFDGAYAVWAADLDVDGDLDMLGAARGDDDITWWENTNGAGTSFTEHTIDGNFDGARSVVAADIDGDGDLDVAGAGDYGDTVAWWENLTIHRTAKLDLEETVFTGLNGARSVAVADLDSDGDLDIASAVFNGSAAPDIYLWLNLDRQGTSWSSQSPATSPLDGAESVLVADIDGDGDPDVVAAASTSNSVRWFENLDGTATSWDESTLASDVEGAMSVAAADLDGDGDTDIVAAAYLANEISVWFNDGDGSSWLRSDLGTPGGPCSVAVGDIDGDGDLDIASATYTGDAISWWDNTAGDGTSWVSRSVGSSFDGARSVSLGDINSDGRLDIIGAAANDDTIAWWRNEGGGPPVSWSRVTVTSSLDAAYSAVAADLDHDGNLDIVATGLDAGVVGWYLNLTGGGSLWYLYGIDELIDGARSACAGDVDLDGDLDVVAAADGSSDTITWWRNRGGQFRSTTVDEAPVRMSAGESAVMLRSVIFKNGYSTEPEIELQTLELAFDDGLGGALNKIDLNSIIETLRVYHDADSSGDFDPSSDTLLVSLDTLLVSEDVTTVDLPHGSPNPAISSYGKTFFVVVETTSDAHLQAIDQFRITFRSGHDGMARYRDFDIPLVMEHSEYVSSSVVEIVDPLIFADQFESGDTSAWSATVP